MRDLRLLVIHHSASPRSTTPAQIEGWHRARNFDGIGYHFVIDDAGIVHRTRTIDRQGAHAMGANRGSIGICATGDNTDPVERWNDVQRYSLRRLVAALRIVLGPLVVERHCQVGTTATECPGLTEDEWRELGLEDTSLPGTVRA